MPSAFPRGDHPLHHSAVPLGEKQPLNRMTSAAVAVAERPMLTPRGQQVKAWYEAARDVELRLTEPNVRACNGLGSMAEVTRENVQAVLHLLDHDPWIRERNIAIDLQDLERPTGRFNFERMLLVVKRKQTLTEKVWRTLVQDNHPPVYSLPDYTHVQPEDLYIRA